MYEEEGHTNLEQPENLHMLSEVLNVVVTMVKDRQKSRNCEKLCRSTKSNQISVLGLV